MTSSTSTLKKNNNNKPIKWATQRIHATTSKSSNRVNKRTATTTSTRTSTAAVAAVAAMTAETEKDPQQEIERLLKELAFTYDNLATITVHFESLHLAYISSKPELDKSQCGNRLGAMEKELLTAYDDLGLQVTHLERKIAKLEKRLKELREKTALMKPSPLISDISSPCPSTDSSVADYGFDMMSDWTFMNDESALLFDQYMPSSSCDNSMFYYNDIYATHPEMTQFIL